MRHTPATHAARVPAIRASHTAHGRDMTRWPLGYELVFQSSALLPLVAFQRLETGALAYGRKGLGPFGALKPL